MHNDPMSSSRKTKEKHKLSKESTPSKPRSANSQPHTWAKEGRNGTHTGIQFHGSSRILKEDASGDDTSKLDTNRHPH